MNKYEIRRIILQERKSLPEGFVREKSEIIIKKVCEYINFYNFNNIMIFMDMENEVGISKITGLYPDKNFYIPKTFPDGEMKISKYSSDNLFLHKFGYYESKSEIYENEAVLDLIIVPGVAFDTERNRIGFGKGYYDRFLHRLINKHRRNNTEMPLTIAVCYDFQILSSIPCDIHDIRPDIIITETRILQ